MTATRNKVTCPICGKAIRQAANREVMLPHTEKHTGQFCSYSGQPIGTTHDEDDEDEAKTA